MRRQPPHQPSPFGAGAPCLPNLSNLNTFFSPEFLNQQHQFFQHPSFQNPFLQNPSFRPLLPQHDVSLNPRVSIGAVEEAALNAHKELVTAGESVSAWKVSQAALASLQVDSWSTLGFQIQDVAFLRKLLFTEGKVNAFIHCFVAAQKITTLYDLEVAICKNESIEQFEELGLGPLCRHPLAQHYFLVPSGLMEIFKISSEDVITCLHSYMAKNKKLPISPDELLTFIAGNKSVPHKDHLGVRIHSLGMHVSFIRQAVKSEQTILNNSLGLIKTETGKAEPSPRIFTPKEKLLLDERFDSISGRVKSFSSICNVATGKHTHFVSSSSDYDTDEYEYVNKKNPNADTAKVLSSNNNSNSQSCPYPSAAEEMMRLGLKLNSSEKLDSPKDKLMDSQGSRSSGKKRKRKRQEKHNDIMKKYLKQEDNIQKSHREERTMVDLVKEKDSYIFPEADIGKFIATWKEACCKGTVAEILDLMINFYMPADISERSKRKIQKTFSRYPGVALIHIAVTSIRRGWLESIYDTVDQIIGDRGSVPSAELVEVGNSVIGNSSVIKDSDLIGNGNITVDDIIKKLTEFCKLNLSKPAKVSSAKKLLKIMKKMSDCETWLAAQYSVTNFSSLGYGDFYTFLINHASLLPEVMHNFTKVKSSEPPCVKVCMDHQQLELLLSQSEWIQSDKGEITKSYVSLLLCKQFPTASFQISGNSPDKFFSDLIKSKRNQVNSGCIVYSISLGGNQLLKMSEDNVRYDSILSKEALKCLLKVPMLSDLLSWSHWNAIYANSLGSLSDWLLNLDTRELLCIATVDGKFIRIDHSATVDEFLEAMIGSSSFQVALNMLSLLALHGGVSNAPVSLLKCYAHRAVDILISTANTNTHDDIGNAATNVSRFILECLEYLPSEFRIFGYDILVSGLQSVVKDAHSRILCECSLIGQRLMLHDIGLSLGIREWIADLHTFNSSYTSDLNISSKTLHKSLRQHDSGENKIVTESQKLLSNNHMSPIIDGHLHDDYNMISNESSDIGSVGHQENSAVQDATSFVELIRREEFGLDSNLNGSESCIVKKQHARLGRALHCLSQELYSQDSHLLLELVQNADDNIYPEYVDPTLVFILHESGIVVLNNEKGFSAQNIRALCDIGNSTKKGSGAGYIGKKGIGFKSVFRVTDAPEIHSNGFHVKFDITEGQIGFVLPTVIAPVDVKSYSQLLLSDKTSSDDAIWKTCIVLPFRSTSKDATGLTSIITMFSDLHPSLLLFLHRLRCIKFMNKVKNTLVIMRREILGNGIVKVTHGQDTMSWLVVSKKLVANHIRPDVQTTEIALAFTLEENESREYKPHLIPQPVFAYLPLRHYGLKFILQGDFVLPSSREEVDGNSAWNQWLLSEYPALYVSAEKSFCSLPCFLKCPGKAVTIYMSFVPNIGEVHGFFSHLPQMIVSRLRTSNCLLLDDPDPVWVLPCKALRGWNQQARGLLSADLLQKHIGLGYLNRDIELSDALARSLGVQEYGPKVLVEVISSICQSKDGISLLGLDWVAAWLCVLHSAVSVNVRMEDDVISSLGKITFIPLSNGLYSSVADGTIWLPCASSSDNIEGKYSAAEFPGLYAKLRTVNPLLFSASADNMYSTEEIKKDNLVYMLNKIGVQHLSAHEIIKSHILVALSNVNCMDQDKKLYIEYLAFIMLHFQHECERCLSDRKDIILKLQTLPVILTNHGFKGINDESIHFGNDYKNPVDMRKLIGGTDLKWHEVDVGYLKHPRIQSIPFGVMKWRTFFMELGITDFIKVTCIKRNISNSTYDDWESEELHQFLSAFSSNKCREKCIYLLEVLDRMWDDVYNSYSRSSIISNCIESQDDCKSLFLQRLVDYSWIASTMDQDLHHSKDLFYDCDEVRSILGDFAPYAIPKVTSKYLCKDIGFKTKVSLDDALNLLRFWRDSRFSLKSRFSILQMTKFYTFISEALAQSNPSVIEDLKSSAFIFVPYLRTFKHEDVVSGTYLSPKELFWHDPTGCVDKSKELYARYAIGNHEATPITSLAIIYPSLYDFFLNRCGVPKNPSFSTYLQILLQLSSTVPPSQSVNLVFQVYAKWASDFTSGLIDPIEILEFKENIIKLEHTILPTSQDKWVSLHPSYGLICWPDDDELKQQFKQCNGLDFLHFGEISKEDREKFFSKVATFLHQIGVPVLSEIVSREAIFYGALDNREKAAMLTWILPYAQRYLYTLHPVIYANMKQNGIRKLSQLQVTVVDELYFKNSLKGLGTSSKKRFACSCLLQGNTLYTTLSANSHSLFLELSRIFFSGSTELQFANFLHMITTMAESGSTNEQTEFFILNSQKIPKLPDDEPVWSFSSLAQIPNISNIQKSQSVSSSSPMNNIDNTTTPVFQNKTPVSSNWPPTNWKTAPDANYARANYHLTRPHTEEISIANEIIINEDTPIANLNNTESDSPTTISNSKKEAILERENLRFETQYDEQQLKQTGQMGEAVAYKYFAERYGAENVKWVNERNETGLPYDLVIGVDESKKEYIEVKATKSARKDWFEVSAREWQFAIEKGEFYTVAHVLLGHHKASVTVLKNPARLCQQNKLHLALLMSANVKPKHVDT